jgi:hypothetical protein
MKISWLAIVALLAVGSLPAAASTSIGSIRVLRTQQPVRHIAADGSRVAVATTTEKANTCDRIVVWSPSKRSSVRFDTGVNCDTGSTINDIQELALAGKTVLWLEADGGNSIELGVYSHTLGTKKTKIVLPTGSYSLDGYGEGNYGPFAFVGNLFGAGNLLVFNSWRSCMEVPVGSPDATCPQSAPGSEPVLLYSEQKLLKVVNGKSVEVASAPDTQIGVARFASPVDAVAVAPAVVAVDANRIAAQYPDGSVTIYSTGGAVLQSIPVPSGTFSGFALQGSRLVTIRNDKLELYNVSSGARLKTIPVAAGSLLRGFEKGLAVYVSRHNVKYAGTHLYVYRKVHVLRLSDRKSVTFSPSGTNEKRLLFLPSQVGSVAVNAQIEASGLFYSYSIKSNHARGRVVFVPFATVLKKLR